MRKMTKLTSMVVTVAMLSSIGMTALANSTSKPADSYGNVHGNLTMSQAFTGVDRNLDNGILTTLVSFTNIQGVTLDTYREDNAGLSGQYTYHYSLPVGTYAAFGTHAVLGSGGSGVTYTYANINQ